MNGLSWRPILAVVFVAAILGVTAQAWVATFARSHALLVGVLVAFAAVFGAAVFVVVALLSRRPEAADAPSISVSSSSGASGSGEQGAGTDALVAKVIEARDLCNAALGARLGAGLAEVGYETLSPVGEAFDSASHRAVDVAELDAEAVPGTIAAVERVGYRRDGILLRPAEVVVYSEVK